MRRLTFPCAAALLVATLFAAPAKAHDFWIEPAAYWTAPGVTTALTLQAGHGSERQRSRIPLRRVIRFTVSTPTGTSVDLHDGLTLGAPTADGAFRLTAPGGHVLALQTDNRAQSHLPAARYNAYLEDEGLASALAWRKQNHETDRDGAEIYSRQAKALIQVGPLGGDQRQVTRPLGLVLEIVPERSPYALPRAAPLPVRVYFEGRPPGRRPRQADQSLARRGARRDTHHRHDRPGAVRYPRPRPLAAERRLDQACATLQRSRFRDHLLEPQLRSPGRDPVTVATVYS